MPQKVYVIRFTYYDDYWICGVAATRELAEIILEQCRPGLDSDRADERDHYGITEWAIQTVPPLPVGTRLMSTTLRKEDARPWFVNHDEPYEETRGVKHDYENLGKRLIHKELSINGYPASFCALVVTAEDDIDPMKGAETYLSVQAAAATEADFVAAVVKLRDEIVARGEWVESYKKDS